MLHLELGLTPFREIIRKKRLLFLHYILKQDKKSIIYNVFKTQLDNKTSKDWVTTVIQDLKDLDWNVSFKEIEKMKKSDFSIILKQKIEQKTLNDLVKRKESHAKVKILKHPVLKMQKYFMAKNKKINIEDCQNIFKMRCRMTKTKTNMKQMFNTYECRACKIETENDQHVLQCNTLKEMNKEYKCIEIPEYEKIYTGNPNEQLLLSQIFYSNLKILENMKEENEKFSTLVEPSDQSNYSASAVYIDTMYKLNWNNLID